MRQVHLIAVGACSIDTILEVPHFPEEDSKLRATFFTRRRGGNCPNTLEVLAQLLHLYGRSAVDLSLVATLPNRTSKDLEVVRKSFNHPSAYREQYDGERSYMRTPPRVNLEHCVYREDFNEPVSSYIISSKATNSRTIINHNALPEMTYDEFVEITEALLGSSNSCSAGPEARGDGRLWFHFEGRIPETTLQCIRYVRSKFDSKVRRTDLKVSVELEKPGREGLQDLAHEADVVFYSRSWAEGEGYTSAKSCLQAQAKIICDLTSSADARHTGPSLLICTWGSSGACAIPLALGAAGTLGAKQETHTEGLDVEDSPAFISLDTPIVDTAGAGDTFIAGALFGLICKGEFAECIKPWSIKKTLDFANQLAGHKILQRGFRVDGTLLNLE